MSTSGDIMMHVGERVDKSLSISVENPDVLNIPRCTHDIPLMYSCYPPNVQIQKGDLNKFSKNGLSRQTKFGELVSTIKTKIRLLCG